MQGRMTGVCWIINNIGYIVSPVGDYPQQQKTLIQFLRGFQDKNITTNDELIPNSPSQ
eukprot:TRINITY_DN3644_c0_g2_i1.p1 TRINITY_DN3644_c0_g2~~TRINITY_DN3644_c0_g2_i1.p1  ORF type:complete len:58 (+),score=3.94 TRINITY_DN3644_c0_g2_i1:339-512(+)